ncbi:hypothetical protein BDF20DRAFT_295955 [Mycotypha africana]|uniref:uncharacterized protein n=1 Tax=Mycotypha africana TaxID=64632 RepID=UPI0023007EFC|nr:uncharacterized protein BDF20DRAFT_295955 [Mycotypha africana]KAI8987931.1 hypothetical protein BDF20DRAFT_295955 [Mycotypha africana]
MKDQQAVSSLSKKIDLARCKGQWPAVLQLSKEYQKTNQHYSAVHDTVRYEAEFYQTLTNLKGHDNNGSQEIHLNDTPLQLHLTLTPQKAKSNTYIQALTHKVERILEKSTKANDFAEGEEYWQLQVTF